MIPKHPMLPLMTRLEWIAEGERRFGPNPMRWRFVCPACGHVAEVEDWKRVGAPEGAVAFSCIGRWQTSPPRQAFGGKGPGPCDYAGGGLFGLNPQPVNDGEGEGKLHHVFAFAEPAPGGAT